MIDRVKEDSPAWRGGLRSFDCIVSVHGWLITLFDKAEVRDGEQIMMKSVANGICVPGGAIITSGLWQHGDTDNPPVPRGHGGAFRPYL